MSQIVKFLYPMSAQVKEVYTGLVGRIMGQTLYHSGCFVYLVLPKKSWEGKLQSFDNIEQDRLMLFGTPRGLANEPYEFPYSIGDKVSEKVTGMKGVIMALCHLHTGCNHYGILPVSLSEGKLQDWNWLDEDRFTLVKENAVLVGKPAGKSPSPGPAPTFQRQIIF